MHPVKSLTLAFIGAVTLNSCATNSAGASSDNNADAMTLAARAIPALQGLDVDTASQNGELIQSAASDHLIFIMAGVDDNKDNVLQKEEVLTASLYFIQDNPQETFKALSMTEDGGKYSVRDLETDKGASTRNFSTAFKYMNRLAMK